MRSRRRKSYNGISLSLYLCFLSLLSIYQNLSLLHLLLSLLYSIYLSLLSPSLYQNLSSLSLSLHVYLALTLPRLRSLSVLSISKQVPADMVVNATLAAMAKHGGEKMRGVQAYHVASSAVNPFVFRELTSSLFDYFSTSPIVDRAGRPIQVNEMKIFRKLEDFSSHLAAASADRNQRSALTDSLQRVKQLTKKSL